MLYTSKSAERWMFQQSEQRNKGHKHHIKTPWNSGCHVTTRCQCHFRQLSTVEAKCPGYEVGCGFDCDYHVTTEQVTKGNEISPFCFSLVRQTYAEGRRMLENREKKKKKRKEGRKRKNKQTIKRKAWEETSVCKKLNGATNMHWYLHQP